MTSHNSHLVRLQLRSGGHGTRALPLAFYTFILSLSLLLCDNVTAQSLAPVQTFSTGANKVVTDGVHVMVGNVDVQVWNNNVNSGTKVRDIVTGYTQPIVAMSALSGSLYTVMSNGPKSIRKWNFLTGAIQWRAPYMGNSHLDKITDLAVSINGVYTSSLDGTIKQWNVTDGTFVATLQAATGPTGFFAPIQKLLVDRTNARLYAAFGRYRTTDEMELASVLPFGDFEEFPGNRFGSFSNNTFGNVGNWRVTYGITGFGESHYGCLTSSGFLYVLLRTWNTTQVWSLSQTINLVPGNTYRLRYAYFRWSQPLPLNNTVSISGSTIATDFNPAALDVKVYTATSAEFLARGKACTFAITSIGCRAESPSGVCYVNVDFFELVLVQRKDNIDNMEVIPVNDGGFENIVVTTTSVTYSGAFGNWTKIAGTGTVAIAKVGSNNFFNLPAAGGEYALWLATATGDDTSVSQMVTLVPGATYMVRWHFTMRQIKDASTENPVSSALNVSLCGTVVANNFTAPSLLFEEASSSLFTPIGTTYLTCNLTLTIHRGLASLRSLLIDEVELVRVRNPHLGSSGGFEGLTDTATSWTSYPGTMGGWASSGHATGRAAIARIPSAECDNIRSLASPYVLWLQSSTSAPAVSMSISINTLVSGLSYRIRWLYARRKQGATIFTSPMLSVSVFGSIVSSGLAPASEIFTTAESNTFIASGSTTTLTLLISMNATVNHMLIDDVEVVLMKDAVIAGSNPLVKEFAVGASSLTPLLDYVAPESWISTVPLFNMNALSVANGRLYVGISASIVGSTCFVMEFSTMDGALSSSYATICNGGSARAIVVDRGHMLVGHVGSVAQILLSDGSLVRNLDWTLGNTPMVDLAVGGWYLFASGNDSQVLKWRLPEWVPTTTTTTTTRTSTTTTRTSTTTSTTTTRTTTSTTTTSSVSTSTPSTTGTATNAGLSPATTDGMATLIKTVFGSAAVFLIAIGIIIGAVVRRRKYGLDPAYRRTYDQEMGLIDPRETRRNYNGAVQLTGPRPAMLPHVGPAYPPGFQRAVYAPSPYDPRRGRQ